MIGDVDVLYVVPKDFAFRCLNRRVYPESVRLAVYKACLDNYTTKKTLWKTMPLIEDGGAVAVHCNYNNLSHLVDFAEREGHQHDVLFFHGRRFVGLRQSAHNASVVPFVMIYKGGRIYNDPMDNLVDLCSESPLEEISCRILSAETEPRDTALFVGDAVIMAPAAKRMCRHVVAFGDVPSVVEELRREGVTIRRMDP